MRKIFFTTILLFLAFGQVFAGTKRIYLVPNSWDDAGALFWVHSYHDTDQDVDDTQFTLTLDNESEVAIYYADIPDTNNKYIFTRTSSASTNPWGTEGGEGKEEWARNTFINAGDNGSKNCCVINAIASDNASFVTLVQETVYKLSSADEVYVNVNRKGDADCWSLVPMTNTGFTYNGAAIYKGIYNNIYGGLGRLQFKEVTNEVATWTHIIGTSDTNSWTTNLSDYLNKIYNGSSWLTFGRDITFYAIPEDATHYGFGTAFDVSTHTLYANFKYGSSGSEWTDPKPTMSKTIYKYNGNWLYKVTVLATYNVVKQIQFQVYNGGSHIEEYQYDGGDCGNSTRCDLSNVTADDIDGKIFGGDVSGHTWYDYAPDTYTVELHPNEGSIWEGSVDSYTFGVGATLPTNVTKWGYDFAGWYDNAELEGDPVTAITTSDSGNKDYYAKWTSIVQNYPIAEHPEFLAAQEGDIITVNVTGVHTSAAIYLQYTNGTTIANRSISETGTYAFQLSADAAAEIRTNGLLVTGQNFTYSDVDILYRKTIWEGVVDATGSWAESGAIDNDLFAGLHAGDFLGVTVNKINDNKDSWHTYAIRAAWRTNIISHDMSDPGVGVDILTDALVDSLQHKDISLVSSYLSCTAIHTYTHTRIYTVEEHTNGGRIWADSVGSYTFGVGATLPTNVTKWNHNFDGWYANSSFEGEPVTTITTTDTGNKEYYAKWTSILKEYPVASHPELLTVQEGDIIVVNVTSVQTSSTIYLYGLDYSYTEIEHRDIASTGKHVFQLSAAAAANLRNYGFFVAGNNFTFDDVEIRYRKTIWTGPLNAEDNWKVEEINKSIFSGLSGGDFMGFDISKINTGDYHQYAIRAGEVPVLGGSCTDAGVGVYELSAANVTALQNATTADIVAQYLEIAHLYAYSGIFVIYRTGDAPVGGGIETFAGGTIDSPIEYRMKVHTLDQWYSLYLPFTVDAIKVIEDGVYYDIQPYYRPKVGDPLYQGHYIIRTPAKTEDFEIANFSDWRDPDYYNNYKPSGYTPYVIMWHDSYFLGKYIAFFGHKDTAIPNSMTVGDRPTKDSVVNVYGNDAMVSGSVEDGYTLEADYGNGAWLREETIGDSRTVLPFECYLRANAKTTPIFKVVRKQDVTTAIPMTNDPLSKPHKVLINGQVVILRDNKMYNVLGIEIQ